MQDGTLKAEAGAYAASTSVKREVGAGPFSCGGEVSADLGVGGGAGIGIQSRPDRDCLTVSAGVVVGIGARGRFEFCWKKSWNPFSTYFWT